MRSLEALSAALGMRSYPRLARKARRLPLPKGVTFVLEIAAGDAEALREAGAFTGHSQAVLQEAAGFFIEQVLFSRHGDIYRTLGASCDASHGELRYHMALLMRWLHPDVLSGGASPGCFDRSIYVNRVTKAWEAVKTDERRAAYDKSLASPDEKAESSPVNWSKQMVMRPAPEYALALEKRPATSLIVSQPRRLTRWSCFLILLGGRG